jgi:hypothetical protein
MRSALVLLALGSACAHTPQRLPPDPQGYDGTSCERGIPTRSTDPFAGVFEEYRILGQRLPGTHVEGTSLLHCGAGYERPADVLHVVTPSGDKLDVYFDIRSYYGKAK